MQRPENLKMVKCPRCGEGWVEIRLSEPYESKDCPVCCRVFIPAQDCCIPELQERGDPDAG